jgi:hypothetical protein
LLLKVHYRHDPNPSGLLQVQDGVRKASLEVPSDRRIEHALARRIGLDFTDNPADMVNEASSQCRAYGHVS